MQSLRKCHRSIREIPVLLRSQSCGSRMLTSIKISDEFVVMKQYMFETCDKQGDLDLN